MLISIVEMHNHQGWKMLSETNEIEQQTVDFVDSYL